MDIIKIHQNSYPKACSTMPVGKTCGNAAAYKIVWKGCSECRRSNIPYPTPTDPHLLSIFRTDVDELKGHPACGRKEYICQDCINNDRLYTIGIPSSIDKHLNSIS